MAELQQEGNVAFGVGQALFEEMLFDNGQLQNGSLADYMISSIKDQPRDLNVDILENLPAGVIHGLGESTLPPVMPAIGNAIARATGVRIVDLPITPEKILRGLRELDGRPVEAEGRPQVKTPPTPGTAGEPMVVDADGKLDLTLHVNGRAERVHARAHHTILQVLRDELALTGVREGCGVGMCGACTILVDGKPMSACLLLAPMAVGREITTIEGLESPRAELDVVQQSFVDNTGFQCSYCTPGFVLATKALLAENPDVTEDEAREYLAGNLCRCGSYVKIVKSVLDARDRLAAGRAGDREQDAVPRA